MNNGIQYLFLDESGNLDFSPKGTRYFSLCSVSMLRPFALYEQLDNYKYDLIESGYDIDIDSFHYAVNNVHIRSEVFKILNLNLGQMRIDSLVVEKCKTIPELQKTEMFYPRMLGYLLQYVFRGYQFYGIKEIIVITDTIPVRKNRRAIERAVKLTLAEMLPTNISYRILHHASKAHYGIQIADYCGGAVFRKWESNDDKYYHHIKPALKSEFDIFKTSKWVYY